MTTRPYLPRHRPTYTAAFRDGLLRERCAVALRDALPYAALIAGLVAFLLFVRVS